MAKNKRERRISKNEKRAIKNGRKMREAVINAQAQKEADNTNKKTVEEIWKIICAMVVNLNKTRKETLLETWNYIKDKEFKERTHAGLTEIDEKIMGMIEDEIGRLVAERDEDYFREVEYVTRFDYLMENVLMAQARLGHSSRKFKSLDNFKRYCDLRIEMERLGDEESAIKILLNNPETDEVTKRILLARQENMKQYRKRKEGASVKELR